MEVEYREALTEIYEILLYIDQESFDEIPFEVIYKITENKSNSYDFKIDDKEEKLGNIIKNRIKEPTKEILAYLYLKYWNKNEDEKSLEELEALEQTMKIQGLYDIFTLSLDKQYIEDKVEEEAYNEFIKNSNATVEENLPIKNNDTIFTKIKRLLMKLRNKFKKTDKTE